MERYSLVVLVIISIGTECFSQSSRDFWNDFTRQEIIYRAIYSNANSTNLGTNLAGYDHGRYGIHCMLWGHLAWARSPEYSASVTTDAERRQYLQTAANAIATMTSATHFKDVSNCSSVSYKGPTHAAINRHEDGYKGWGSKRDFDVMLALPESMPRVLRDEWYRVKIRCENAPAPSNFTTITVWLAPDGAAFPAVPHYHQTYKGKEFKGETIVDVKDENKQEVWYRKGTVAILTCFSDVSIRNLTVFRGCGAVRTPFYELQQHGASYIADIASFNQHWVRVGYDNPPESDRDVWFPGVENGSYVISTTAAQGHTVLMDPALRNDGNRGVYAAAYLRYTDASSNSSFELEDCEVEYDIRLSARSTGYAESGMAMHFNNATGNLVTYLGGNPPDLGDQGVVESSPEEMAVADEVFHLAGNTQGLVSFSSYYRHKFRYLAVNLRPDHLSVVHHRESVEDNRVGMFFGGTPWDTGANLDADSVAYFEGHNYEGEMAGAILRWCRYVSDPATHSSIRNHYSSDASAYIAAMNDHILAKWINNDQGQGAQDLFNGACRSNNLLGGRNMNEGAIWRYSKARSGSMFLHAIGLNGINPTYRAFAEQYCSYYHNEIVDAMVPVQLNDYSTWQWYDGSGWWGTYDNRITDAPHYGSEIRHIYLAEMYGMQGLSDVGVKMASNFIRMTWNGEIGALADLYIFRNPTTDNNQLVKVKGNTLPDYPLLAKYNFEVWEILHDLYKAASSLCETGYGLPAAQMAYMVRYGIPRNLRAESLVIRECGSGDVVTAPLLRWDPPSDYPCGYEDVPGGGIRRPGSRLRRYHIQRKDDSEPDWSNAATFMLDISDLQSKHQYPCFIDATATAGMTYQYRIRTQDHSADITNLSDFTDVITVTYPAQYSGFYDSRNGLLKVDMFPWSLVSAGQTRTVPKGVYYAPFNIEVQDGGELVIDPSVQIIFGDSCRFEVHGALEIQGSPECGLVTLTGVTDQGTGTAAGSWWGLTLHPTAVHSINYAIIENAINNVVVYDPMGVIQNSELRYAGQHGAVIKNATGTVPNGQLIEGCVIHNNGWSNLLITYGAVDASGAAIPIYPVIRNSIIHSALGTQQGGGDGVIIIENAYAFIDNCIIHSNTNNGVHCEQVRGDVFYGMNVRIENCDIYNHETGAGVLLVGSNGLIRETELHGNEHGIAVKDASILHGALNYGSIGGNQLYSNVVNLLVDNCNGVYFGVYFDLLNDSRGHRNVFSSPGQYQVQSLNSSGFVQCDTFNPGDPAAYPSHFDIPGYPWDPELVIPPVGLCTPPSGSVTKANRALERMFVLRSLPEIFRQRNDVAALELLREYELDTTCRRSILTWIGSYAIQGPHSERYLEIIDSLSSSWTGVMLSDLEEMALPACLSLRGAKQFLSSHPTSKHWRYLGRKADTLSFDRRMPVEILSEQIRRRDTVNQSFSLITPKGGEKRTFPGGDSAPKQTSQERSGLVLYPNPSQGTLTLSIVDGRVYRVGHILDLLGREIMTFAVQKGSSPDAAITVKLPIIPRGRYILTLHGDNISVSTPLLIE